MQGKVSATAEAPPEGKRLEVRSSKMGAVKLSLPSYCPPVVEVEKPTKDGIALYGEDNRFPQHSIDHFKKSPTHNAICRWTAKLFAGNGFDFTGADPTWVKNLGYGQSINRIGKRLALDLKIHNGYSFHVYWAKDGRTVSRIKFQDFSQVRKLVDANHQTVAYLICKDWKKETKPTDKGVLRMEVFDPEQVVKSVVDAQGKVVTVDGNEVKEHDENGLPVIAQPVQLYYYEGPCPGMVHYTYPDYIAADVDIEIDILFKEFHVNNILNGLLPSFVMVFKGPEPEDEDEKAEFLKDMEKLFKGTKGKKFMAIWAGEEGMDLTPLDVKNNESRYLEIHKHAITQIISGHMLQSPTLAGIAGSGTLGGNANEIEAAFKLYALTTGTDGQDQLIEGFQHVFDRAGMAVEVSIISRNPYEVEATTTTNSGGGETETETEAPV